jgi:chromosome partitioning protein
MHILVTTFESGTSRTTTAVHVASYLQAHAPTLLIDRDPSGPAMARAARGRLRFTVAGTEQAVGRVWNHGHIVIDTEPVILEKEMEKLATVCDLVIIPVHACAMDTHGAAFKTLECMRRFAPGKYKVLISKVPARSKRGPQELRSQLIAEDVPVFGNDIPYLKAFHDAETAGLCVSDLKGTYARRASQAYEAIGREIMAQKL